jgi:hypothetical protein
MAAKIIAIEFTGAASSSLSDLRYVTIRNGMAKPTRVFGHIQVQAVADDGSKHQLFSYFSDELSFTPDELSELLVGTTLEEAKRLGTELHEQRDSAYLRA